MRVSKITATALACSLGLLVACTQKAEEPTAAEPTEEAAGEEEGEGEEEAEEAAEPAGDPGNIEVTVKFEGEAPEREILNRKADPYCAKTKMKEETVMVNDNGTLKNVAVTLDKVRGSFDAPKEPLKVDQKDCMYRPRVQFGVEGQDVEITNSDMTLHNVHTYKGENLSNWFNRAQPPKAPPITEVFKNDGLITFKCDVHPWMGGYVMLADHPFGGVTEDAGEVTLSDVPSMSKPYTLVTWHEKLGRQETEVTVEPGKTAEVTVTYKADQGTN